MIASSWKRLKVVKLYRTFVMSANIVRYSRHCFRQIIWLMCARKCVLKSSNCFEERIKKAFSFVWSFSSNLFISFYDIIHLITKLTFSFVLLSIFLASICALPFFFFTGSKNWYLTQNWNGISWTLLFGILCCHCNGLQMNCTAKKHLLICLYIKFDFLQQT